VNLGLPDRDEEFTDASSDDYPDYDMDIQLGAKVNGEDRVPRQFDWDCTRLPVGLNVHLANSSRSQHPARHRIRIRGYRPLDELRSFAKVLITSLNKEFVSPLVDDIVPPPPQLSEGLGDAHIMGSALCGQMKAWLADPGEPCSRDMASYFKAASQRSSSPHFRPSPSFDCGIAFSSLRLLSR
jgi:hypothetical protein